MFLIGSRAAKYHGLRVNRNVEKSDWDVIGSNEELEFFKGLPTINFKESSFPGKFHIRIGDNSIEFDATNNLSNQLISTGECTTEVFKIGNYEFEFLIPSKEILYQIKRSHVNFVHFDKSIMDLRAMQKQWNMYNTRNEVHNSLFFKERFSEAAKRFGERQNRIKLNKSNEEFFKGGMNLRTYVHDDIHRAVAFYDAPLFERCKKNIDSAFISKELFFNLPYEDQVRMAVEESSVIAIERFYLPSEKKDISDGEKLMMYRQGMLKEIRDLSKGWFQDFMIDNILDIEQPQQDYITKFENALKAGKVNTI